MLKLIDDTKELVGFRCDACGAHIDLRMCPKNHPAGMMFEF